MSERQEVHNNVVDNFGSDLYSLEIDLERVGMTWDECYALERRLQRVYTDFLIRIWKICLANPDCNPPLTPTASPSQ